MEQIVFWRFDYINGGFDNPMGVDLGEHTPIAWKQRIKQFEGKGTGGWNGEFYYVAAYITDDPGTCMLLDEDLKFVRWLYEEEP